MELTIYVKTVVRAMIVAVLLLTLAGLAARFALYVFGDGPFMRPLTLFDVGAERNIPTWFESMQFMLCSVLLVVVAIASRQRGERYGSHWGVHSVILLYLSLDEVATIHETMGAEFERLLHATMGFEAGGAISYFWVVPGALFVVVVGLSYIGFLIHLPRGSTPFNRGEYSSRMSSLQQPSRSSTAPLGYSSRGNGEAQQFVKRPALIGEPRRLSRGSLDPSPLASATPRQPQRAMRLAEVVDRSDQPHARLQRSLLSRCRTRFARQRDKARAEGGLKPLDIRGVDDRRSATLRVVEPGRNRFLRANYDTPDHLDYPSPGVALDGLGDHEALRQEESGTPSLSGVLGLAQHAQSLLGVTRKPIGAKQQGLERPAGTYTFEQRANQLTITSYLHHSAQPQPTTNRDRRCQPHYAADDADTQLVSLHLREKHSSGLHQMFVEAPALVPAFALPAGDGALVQREGRDDGLRWAAVCQQGYDGHDQLMWLVHPVESCALGGREGSAASFAAVAALFSAMDHDMSLGGSSVGPATLVVAESSLRVHMRILLLTLDTNKDAAGPACSSTPWLNHDSLGYYPPVHKRKKKGRVI